MPRATRRDVVAGLLAATAAATLPGCGQPEPAGGDAAPPLRDAGSRLSVGVIGLGGFGIRHVRAWRARPDCRVTWICDVDASVGARVLAEEFGGPRAGPRFTQDLRHVLDDPAVDVVSIATPHHWHALAAMWAMEAGKDVYLEKPVSHTFVEGQWLVAAARRLGRICQSGTQRRSHGAVRAMVAHVRAGGLGRVTLAHCLTFKRRQPIGPAVSPAVPRGVDLGLWCGPAPLAAPVRGRFHYDWHWFWEHGNGAIGNNGIHRIDVARWALGVDDIGTAVMSAGARYGPPDCGETPNTQWAINVFRDCSIVTQVRGLPAATWRSYGDGVVLFGTEGIAAYSGRNAVAYDLHGRQQRVFSGRDQDHFGDFVAAVRSRRATDLAADIREGHLSSALCHLANASQRLGRVADQAEVLAQARAITSHDDVGATFEDLQAHLASVGVDPRREPLTLGPWLRLDPAREAVLDPAAAPYLTRDYRAPFTPPSRG